MSAHASVEWLSAYLDSELAEPARAEVASHLAECEACRARLERLREVSAGLRAFEAPQAPPSLRVGVRGRVAESGGLARWWSERLRRSGRWSALPAAAPLLAVILALGVGFYVLSDGVARREAGSLLQVDLSDARAPEAPLATKAVEELEAPAEESPAEESPVPEPDLLEEAAPRRTAPTEVEAPVQVEAAVETEAPAELEAAASEEVGSVESLEVAAAPPPSAPAATEVRGHRRAAAAVMADSLASPESRSIGGRRFLRAEGGWIEEGLDGGSTRTVSRDSDEGISILESLPELADIDEPVRLSWKDEVVELAAP